MKLLYIKTFNIHLQKSEHFSVYALVCYISKRVDQRNKRSKMTGIKYGNETESLNHTVTSTQSVDNKTLLVSSKPVEVVIKKSHHLTFASNNTGSPIVSASLGKGSNSLTKNEKATGKGATARRKRAAAFEDSSFHSLDYEYPTSKEIPNVQSDEFSSALKSSEDSIASLDLDSFGDDFLRDFVKPLQKPFTKPLGKGDEHKKSKLPLPSSFTSFFSGEDIFSHLSPEDPVSLSAPDSAPESLLGLSAPKDSPHSAPGGSLENSNSKQEDYSAPLLSKEKDYSDERDTYDIHGFRDYEERSAQKPPAYKHTVTKGHDYTLTRMNSGKPVVFDKLEKKRLVGTFNTRQIHQFPGFALPGASTENMSKNNHNSHHNINHNINTNPQTHNKINMNHNKVNMNPNHMNINHNKINMNHNKVNMNPNQMNMNMNINMSEDDEDEHHHHHFYDQLRHVHYNPPPGFDPDSFRLTLPQQILKQLPLQQNKKHKHFHHIQNSPVIIKYTTPPPPRPPSPPPTIGIKQHPTKKPLSDSEEEAMYDEEHEISEKEIENAYKHYDDAGVHQDVVHDYQTGSGEAEESKVQEIAHKRRGSVKTKNIRPKKNRNVSNENTIFNNVSKEMDPKFKITKKPRSYKNFWKLEYSLK